MFIDDPLGIDNQLAEGKETKDLGGHQNQGPFSLHCNRIPLKGHYVTDAFNSDMKLKKQNIDRMSINLQVSTVIYSRLCSNINNLIDEYKVARDRFLIRFIVAWGCVSS